MALQPVSAIWGDKYGPEYVQALKKQVPDIHILGHDSPLRTSLEYWWVKLEWFAPWNADLRPCLWIDLDTYVFDLEPFNATDTGHFWMIDDFNTPSRGESGLMVIPKDVDRIWKGLLDIGIRFRSPDAAYLRNFQHRRLNTVVNGIYSYKRHCWESRPEDAVICAFHGRPNPHEVTDGWAKAYWESVLA